MSSLLLWVTLSIVLAQATVPPVKAPPVQPPKPVKPAPVVKTNNKTEGFEKKTKKWVKYVAVPDVKHRSNDTIFAYRYGKNLG